MIENQTLFMTGVFNFEIINNKNKVLLKIYVLYAFPGL